MAIMNQGQDKIIRVSLIGEVSTRDTSTSTDQRFVNCYPEIIFNPTESYNPVKKVWLVKRPGLKNLTSPTAGVGRGIYPFNNKIYSVVGGTVYSTVILNTGQPSTSTVGTLASTGGKVTFSLIDGNTKALVLNDGIHIYMIDTNNVLTQIGDKTLNISGITANMNGSTYLGTCTVTTTAAHDFNAFDNVNIASVTPTAYNGSYSIQSVPSTTTFTINIPTQPAAYTSGGTVTRPCGLPSSMQPGIVYLDGYLFVMDSTGTIYNSYVQDATDWQALSFLQSETQPDGGVGLGLFRNQVVAFGEWTTEFFSDVGSQSSSNTSNGSPLQRTLGGAGTIPLGCAAANSIVYADQTYYWIIRDQSGGHSVAQLEGFNAKIISRPPFDRLLDAEGSGLVNAIAFHVKQAGHSFYVLQLATRTLVLDIIDGSWTEWTSGSSKFLCSSSCEFNSVPYLLDDSTGAIYKFDPATYQDNGTNFTVLLQTNRIDFNTTKRKFLRNLEVVGDEINTNLSISWSNDDYQTWSNTRTVYLGRPRAYLTSLGQFRRRAFKISHTDNTPLRLAALDFNIDIGES